MNHSAEIQNLSEALDAVAAIRRDDKKHATEDERYQFNLQVDQLIYDASRMTGRTTAAILQVMADAIRTPNKWVVFNDPGSMRNQKINPVLGGAIRFHAEKLNLTLDVEYKRGMIFVRSPLARLRARKAITS